MLILWCSGGLALHGSFTAYAASAQVEVTARAIPDQVTIGGEIKLYLQIDRPRKYEIVPPSEKISLAPFEIKKIEHPPYGGGSNRIREVYTLTLTVFELGDLKIPPFPVSFKDGAGKIRQVMTEAVSVKVVSVGKKKGEAEKLRPIKGPVSVDLRDIWYWTAGILAALLTLILAVKVIVRVRKTRVDPETLKPPHERALIELERLKKKGLLGQDKAKEFYSGLSDILRRYLERRFGIEALEQTTFEVLEDLKAKNFETAVSEKIKTVLENTDLVKFAKFEPPRSLADELEKVLVGIVAATRPGP